MEQTENQLIELLPAKVQKRLMAMGEQYEMEFGEELCVRGEPLSHAYFPRTGFISLLFDLENLPHSQVGMVGSETMVGSELVLGQPSAPWRSVVTGAGNCLRIEAKALRKVLPEMPELERLLLRTLVLRMQQLALGTTCERFHRIPERLARWLLMSQDRTQGQPLRATQEFISQLLGVRRTSVSTAAYAFQKGGLIEYSRAEIKVLDRVALESAACSCYKAEKLLFSGLVGATPPAHATARGRPWSNANSLARPSEPAHTGTFKPSHDQGA